MFKIFWKPSDNLGCPPGNQAIRSGCPEPYNIMIVPGVRTPDLSSPGPFNTHGLLQPTHSIIAYFMYIFF